MTIPCAAPFACTERAAQWTKGLLLANIVISVVSIISGILQLELISQATIEGISDAEAASNDSRQQLIGILQFILFIGTSIAFLIWFYNVHNNLSALGSRELKYTPGWAVGGFFVPFLNCVRPLQVMREVWHGSNPSGLALDESPGGPAIRNQLRTPTLVGWWWVLFLLSNFVSYIIMRLGFRIHFSQNQTLEQFQALSGFFVISDLLEIPSALVAILLVSRIMSWQSQRIELIRQRVDNILNFSENRVDSDIS